MRLPRLYAILDVDTCRRHDVDPLDRLDVWLDEGVRLFQLRAKSPPASEMLAMARGAVARAARSGAVCVINDRVDIAYLAGAAGVHVGQDDLSPVDCVRLLGPDGLVGLSTHSPLQVERACAQPINYLAIGPVFPTQSKARPDPVVGLEGVHDAVTRAGATPVVAIGGIDRARAGDVLRAGASSVAVISDLMAADARGSVRAWLDAVAVV